ncbi:hypothetical protein HYDPIDRAFT_31771 [Hydnomerulius pinastri MD-312]|uniref:DUF7729 domain-containing protein n=1 Tax=Hydnomerulius pinastri MD-312 TaxID=994086 RepID=A0A0C9WB45_9AGAM|nr:hypothetical protein HYDPIDRAFT_31771 [Hydnomerulius pinastri MD-312]
MAISSFAILSVLISAAWAQSSSNPLIPSGISSNCSSYLTSLNNNADFASCTNPITSALSQFAPGANASGISTTTINSALNNLCSTTAFSACPDSTIRSQLGSFYAACAAELTSNPNVDVKRTYDTLYVLTPLRQAVCAKDDNGKYCAAELGSSSGAAGSVDAVNPEQSRKQELLDQYLYSTAGEASPNMAARRRDVSNTTAALIPNTTTYQDTNLVFMFLEPSMASAQLCTTCTREILTPYINFESSCPYAPGMSSSMLISGQPDLYNNITSKCGASFLGGAVQAAGGLSSGILSGAAPRSISQDISVAVSAILGAAALAVASF